jgi:hypothetical protein
MTAIPGIRRHEHTRRAFVPVLVVALLGLDLGVD